MCHFTSNLAQSIKTMLCYLVQNNLLSIDAELEEDQFKRREMRELSDREKFTGQVL